MEISSVTEATVRGSSHRMETQLARMRETARLSALLGLLALTLAPWSLASAAAELGALSRTLVSRPTEANFQALQQFADRASGRERDLALYSIGMARYGKREFPAAEKAFAAIGGSIDWLAEHAAYYRARCIVLDEAFERALGPLQGFVGTYRDSRFRPAAERLRAESLLRLGRHTEARRLLAPGASRMEEAVRLYLAGRVEHVTGNRLEAIKLYRRAYYYYPFSDQARAAESHLDRLRSSMGDAYPDAPAQWRLARAEALLKGRSHAKASAEFTRALAAGLAGEERDKAVIGRGAADYHRRRSSVAYSALAKARPSDPGLEAQRLYLLCAIERRQGLVGPMLSSLAKLADRHAASSWYQEALLAVGNHYYLKDDRREYPRVFRRLVEAFPKGEHAPYGHWKLTWRAWLDRTPERGRLLTEHFERFPSSPTAAGAVYWLGRLHEREGRIAEARACYQAITAGFPNYYYAFLAGERLESKPGPIDKELAERLAESIPPPRRLSPEPRDSTRALLDMGRTMAELGLQDEASEAFSRVDYRQADAHFAGHALGRLHSEQDRHHLALRAMKRYAFGYLRMPFEYLDEDYWRYLFPLGWEDSLRARSERHGLDPYLVAGLIRQESEYHPQARSRAGALGLMQIMPSTGRGLFRRLGISGFSSRKLTSPDLSLRLGTFHLKEVLAQFDGQLEKALAGYNAGERRIPQWMRLGPFKEPAEFVETIPFTETRGYVQSVIRNREMYERVYGD